MPVSSKTDPLLANCEPIGNSGSASGITALRRGRGGKTCAILEQQERQVRQCERSISADTRVSEKGGGGGAPGAEAEIPLQPMEKTMVRQAVPLQPVLHCGPPDIHLQPMENPTLEQLDVCE